MSPTTQQMCVRFTEAIARCTGYVAFFYLSIESIRHLSANPQWLHSCAAPLMRTTMPLPVLLLIGIGIALSIALVCRPFRAWAEDSAAVAETLRQSRTAELLAINARLTAEIAAYQQSAVTVANENARLLEQAKESAASEERTRLARDLHDSVTQTLYSASLIAQVLPAIWQRNPSEGARNLIKLRQLVRGALAEMRTLLFELRPAALEAANLGVLIQQLGDVLTGHTRIPVTVTVSGEAEPPTAVKIALYRIVQEAFNNIAKHAGATQVTVTVALTPSAVQLHLHDNGRGFDPTQRPGECMGVSIMAERAMSVDAHFALVSAPGQGVAISLDWPMAGNANSAQHAHLPTDNPSAIPPENEEEPKKVQPYQGDTYAERSSQPHPYPRHDRRRSHDGS